MSWNPGIFDPVRGVATKFCLGGRIHRHPNPPTPKFSFSSDFGQFILEMVENAKFSYASRKKMLKYHTFWGDVPADFSTPAFDAHGSCQTVLSWILCFFMPRHMPARHTFRHTTYLTTDFHHACTKTIRQHNFLPHQLCLKLHPPLLPDLVKSETYGLTLSLTSNVANVVILMSCVASALLCVATIATESNEKPTAQLFVSVLIRSSSVFIIPLRLADTRRSRRR